ncbi:MAG: hypothetical protein M0R38_10010 [Bacteroidia bacterium]|nr:hypothetical protein [Bacteroidia bacterium]
MNHKQKHKVGLAIEAVINIMNSEKDAGLATGEIARTLPTGVVHTEFEEEKLELLLKLLYVINDNELFSEQQRWNEILDDVISQDYDRYSQYLTEDFLYSF